MYREKQKTESWQCSNHLPAPSCLSTVTKPLNAALRLFLSLVACPLETVLSYYPRLLLMNNLQCLTGISALAFSASLSHFRCAGGGYPVLLCSVQVLIRWMGKDKLINLMELYQVKGEKITVLCWSVSVSEEPLSIPLYFTCPDSLLWKKPNPFKITLLWIWVSWFLTGRFNTSLVSLLIPSPVNEAPAPLCLNALQLLSHGPAQLSGSSPPEWHVSGVRPHTQQEKAHVMCLLQAALLPRVARGGFWYPSSTTGLGRPQTPRPLAAPPAPANQCCLPVCWQKAKSGEERTADFKQQQIKRHKGRQINQLTCLRVKNLGCLGRKPASQSPMSTEAIVKQSLSTWFKRTPEIKSKTTHAGEFHQPNPTANYLL